MPCRGEHFFIKRSKDVARRDMSSVDLYKKMRGARDSGFLDFFFLFGQAKRKEAN